MDSVSDSISRVVAILTAIISGQEEIANQLVIESDPVELFSALTGILLSAIQVVAIENNKTTEDYLQQLAMLAFKSS